MRQIQNCAAPSSRSCRGSGGRRASQNSSAASIESVVALLTARRSRIKVKDIPMAAFVIINTVEHLTHVAQTAGHDARDLARLERELNDLVLSYLVGARRF